MAYREPFGVGEWYHCYSRGVEKRNVFENELDSNRFLMALYLANGSEKIQLFNERKPKVEEIFKKQRTNLKVAIGAYCLMPNHYHLLLKEVVEGGITSFMRKVGTAYTMYFNERYERVGNLFVKPFRSRRIGTDRYLQRVIEYIHCNPAEIYESGWKSGKVRNIRILEQKLLTYPYSSFAGHMYRDKADPILSSDIFTVTNKRSVSQMLEESRKYYAEIVADSLER